MSSADATTEKKTELKSSDGETPVVDENVSVQSEMPKNMMVASKKIELKSSDGEILVVDETVAVQSVMLKNIMEDVSPGSGVSVPNVTAEVLEMVIEYCKRHAQPAKDNGGEESKDNNSDELKAFDAEFVNVDQGTLFDVIMAANYLDIKWLLDLTCQAVAEMIKDKSPEEVRELFNIMNDYTPEEEEETRNS